MSTTTCLQLEELSNKPSPFHRCISSESRFQHSIPTTTHAKVDEQTSTLITPLEAKQRVLLLRAAREQYTLVDNHHVPSILHPGEVLVKVLAIGLNPIDWKGPAYNFGIPSLPWINGRDLAGLVLQVPNESSRLRVGDIVLVPSTDYRDIRKAAFQEYAIATDFNAARIPSSTSIHASASLGVAFVAAVLALGVSFGLDFSRLTQSPGPNLMNVVNQLNKNDVPADVQDEVFAIHDESDRPQRGDWLAIWGASTTTGLVTLQLAKLAGLRVICVADIARHGAKLLESGADLLVDRHDTDRAVEIIRGVTGGKLRYAIDIVGKDTATILEKTLDASGNAHLLGLTGLPKERNPGIKYHTVPIKLFHSAPAVGESMVTWLESLLQSSTLTLPEIVRAEGGLEGINAALDILRSGTVSGKRIVVDLGSEESRP
ncbi:Polyketide synthase enoylreductase [Penicillium longicatenatum]|uniref:Polyketide synthase enoylreductase n=1 Tax=Penicillium longicatenatum TaxID=1561947 RepID=UPI002547F115|nr:Polyketide synthase enoylreductase [Penicillium longicatenatum]KAJ5651228.1 Polyketide synthase enoylreductase [Penicillium longicatenatum]